MAFQVWKVTKPTNLGTGMGASLKKIRSARAGLTLTLSGKLAEDLGLVGPLAVLIGTDADQGLLRLRADPDGEIACARREFGGRGGPVVYYAVALGHVPIFPDRSEAKRWVKWSRVDDGWIEVRLPAWADPPASPKTPLGPNPAVTLAIARAAPSPAALPPPETRGEARRLAEAREAPALATAEAVAEERAIDAGDFVGRLMTRFGLTRTEALYLEVMLDGRLATRERLIRACHPDEDIEDKNVDVLMHRLRGKLKTSLVMVETVRAQGFRISAGGIARVRRLVAETAEAS